MPAFFYSMILFFPLWLIFKLFVGSNNLNTYNITGYAQGTSYQIIYYHPTETVKKPEIDGIFATLDSSLSIYKPYSLISEFNRSPTGIKTDRHLRNVATASLEIHKATNGAFDITVQPLVQAWGFGPEKSGSLPDSGTIKNLLLCVGSGKLKLNSYFLGKNLPCVKIDVNGIAQGYSVDVLANYLRSKGIRNFLVEVGGEIVVEGRKPSGELMIIGIEGPGETGKNPTQKKIRLEKGAITTSGNYVKFYRSGGKNISHLIDAKTGYSLQNELISVTVYAKDAITADGYDNAFMSAGLKKSFKLLKKHKSLAAYFIYKKPDGSVVDTASSGFYRLLKN